MINTARAFVGATNIQVGNSWNDREEQLKRSTCILLTESHSPIRSCKILTDFIPAFLDNDQVAMSKVTGVTPAVLAAAATGVKQAMADSVRIVYIIAAPFGVLAVVACFFMGDLSKSMNYRVEAPVEDLHAKVISYKEEQLTTD